MAMASVRPADDIKASSPKASFPECEASAQSRKPGTTPGSSMCPGLLPLVPRAAQCSQCAARWRVQACAEGTAAAAVGLMLLR